MKIFLISLLISIPLYSQNDFVTNTSTFLENNYIIEISVNHQNPLNTEFISSFCRLDGEFKAQLTTTEFKYFNVSSFNSYEYQGSIILNIIYFGTDNFTPQNIKLVLEDNTEYDFAMDSDSRIEFVEKSNKYHYSGHSKLPLSVFLQFIKSKTPKIKFTGSRIFKRVLVDQKAHKFFYSFYNSLTGYYFDDKKSGD